ncbi:MAG: DMT family transporter [Lachnospiraceae bacterium]|nr:DMT family transporter [Lachnospiraceae bacterium]
MKSYIYAMLAVVLWATISPFSKLMLNALPEEEFLFLTMLIATITLFVINIVTKKILVLKTYHIKDYLILFGLGALGIYLYILTYNMGIAGLKASDACIINYLWPIMIIIFSVPVLHEKLVF